jgi:hypothetical protein
MMVYKTVNHLTLSRMREPSPPHILTHLPETRGYFLYTYRIISDSVRRRSYIATLQVITNFAFRNELKNILALSGVLENGRSSLIRLTLSHIP